MDKEDNLKKTISKKGEIELNPKKKGKDAKKTTITGTAKNTIQSMSSSVAALHKKLNNVSSPSSSKDGLDDEYDPEDLDEDGLAEDVSSDS